MVPAGGAQVWMPHHRHLAEQKQGIIAARVDLGASATKARSPPLRRQLAAVPA